MMIINTNRGGWKKQKSERAKQLRAERRARRREKAKAKANGTFVKPARNRSPKKATPNRNPLYKTRAWAEVRYKVLVRDRGICQCCGMSAKDGVVMNVDHIKPLWKYPELALNMDNLQTLCSRCNRGKWGIDETDWRDPLELEFKAVMTE